MKLSKFGYEIFFYLALAPLTSFGQTTCDHRQNYLDNMEELTCLVRYHGFAASKNYNRALPMKESSGFQSYLERGRTGERGAFIHFTVTKGSQYKLKPEMNEHVDADLGLKYKIIMGNHGISQDGCYVYGDIELQVVDIPSGDTLAQTELSLESVLSGQFVGQMTLKLPERAIGEQLNRVSAEEHLLTQVKFQCN